MWYYQINNNKFQAQKTYDLISKSNLVHTNEQSKEEATESLNKPIDITKARLLFDDGDYTKCIQLLHHISTDSLSAYYKPEYHYRLARAYEQNNQLNNAQIRITSYNVCYTKLLRSAMTKLIQNKTHIFSQYLRAF